MVGGASLEILTESILSQTMANLVMKRKLLISFFNN